MSFVRFLVERYCSAPVQVASRAKLNFALRIVGRRDDGWHELDMLVAPLWWGDTLRLTFEPPSGVGEVRSIETAWHPLAVSTKDHLCRDLAENTIYRAWRLAQSVIDEPLPDCRVAVEKRVPVGSGLGGGSGNAAAILSFVASEWQTYRGRDITRALFEAAIAVGSDVPLFFAQAWCRVRGVGDVIAPWTPPRAVLGRTVAVWWPGVAVSSADAYGWFRESCLPVSVGSSDSDPSLFANDLMSVVAAKVPAVERLMASLRRQESSVVWLTGSGGAVVALGEGTDDGAEISTPPGCSLLVVGLCTERGVEVGATHNRG